MTQIHVLCSSSHGRPRLPGWADRRYRVCPCTWTQPTPATVFADWPSPDSGTASAGTPYGPCDGSWSRACAFSYAMQRASYSYTLATAAAPLAAATSPSLSTTLPSLASTAPWWIDVEIGASWARLSSSHEWARLNVAALRGYVAGLRAAGAHGPVGLYSNAYQWHAHNRTWLHVQAASTSRAPSTTG